MPEGNLTSQARSLIAANYGSTKLNRNNLPTVPVTQEANEPKFVKRWVNELGDPHVRFLTQEDADLLLRDLSGVPHVDVGLPELLYLDVAEDSGKPVVVTPLSDSSAANAGLMPGDLIMDINGKKTAGMPFNDLLHEMRGPLGTSVKLELDRNGMPFAVDLERKVTSAKSSKVEAYSWSVDGNVVGYLGLWAFPTGIGDKVRAALWDLLTKKPKGLILDLRNNPGGQVPEARRILSSFLAAGAVNGIFVDGEGKKWIEASQHSEPTPSGFFSDGKLVVLVNHGTASCAEIVAGALQDNRRATIMGEETFGKGLIHHLCDLRADLKIIMPAGQWQTPLGKALLSNGITPDRPVGDANTPTARHSDQFAPDVSDELLMTAIKSIER